MDPLEQHAEGSLPHVQEILRVTGQRGIPHGTEVAVVEPHDAHIIGHAAPDLPQASDHGHGDLIVVGEDRGHLVASSQDATGLDRLIQIIVRHDDRIGRRDATFLERIAPAVGPGVGGRPRRAPHVKDGAMPEIQQVHGHPASAIPFGVDDLIIAVSETTAHHDHRHVFGNVFERGDAGPIVFVDDHSGRPDRQAHAHTRLDGFHVGFIQGNDVQQEPAPSRGGLHAMIRFGCGESGRVGGEHHHGIHLPVR